MRLPAVLVRRPRPLQCAAGGGKRPDECGGMSSPRPAITAQVLRSRYVCACRRVGACGRGDRRRAGDERKLTGSNSRPGCRPPLQSRQRCGDQGFGFGFGLGQTTGRNDRVGHAKKGGREPRKYMREKGARTVHLIAVFYIERQNHCLGICKQRRARSDGMVSERLDHHHHHHHHDS